MDQLTGDATDLGWVAVKAVLLFVVAVAGLRLGERRTLAQLNAFDFAVAVAIGAIIGRTATSSRTSFATGAVALMTLLAAHRLVSALRRHGRFAGLVDQPPRVLVAHGSLQARELARAGLTDGDVVALLRRRGVTRLSDVEYALYESRGDMTIVCVGEPVGPLLRHGLEAAGHDTATLA